jgi:hypothetical protein
MPPEMIVMGAVIPAQRGACAAIASRSVTATEMFAFKDKDQCGATRNVG